MSLKVTVIGTLAKDPTGTETYTIWKVNCFGRQVTLFSSEDSAEARANFRTGHRIRGEGKGSWNDFNDDWFLQINGAAIDGSEEEDALTIKVDGRIEHEIEVAEDDPDEGGGKYAPVEIEAPVRGKNDRGDWDDLTAYVRAMVLGPAVDQLIELDRQGVSQLCFSGNLDLDATFIKGQPSYYAEITNVTASQGRGGDEDAFWSSKPKGLANRKASAPAKSAPASQANPSRSATSKRRSGGVEKELDDKLPF